MVEHGGHWSLHEEHRARLEIRFWEQPDTAHIQHHATSQWEEHEFDYDEYGNLKYDLLARVPSVS